MVDWLEELKGLSEDAWNNLVEQAREHAILGQQIETPSPSLFDRLSGSLQSHRDQLALPVNPENCRCIMDLNVIYQAGNEALHESQIRLTWEEFLVVLGQVLPPERAIGVANLASYLSRTVLRHFDRFFLQRETIPKTSYSPSHVQGF